MLSDTERRARSPVVSSTVDRVRRVLAIAAVAYAVSAAVSIAVAPHAPRPWRLLPDWVALPVQLIAIASCATLLPKRFRPPRTGAIWTLIGAFCVMSLLASVMWNLWRPHGAAPSLSSVDLFYLIDYATITIAYACLFARYGGSFRDPRTWLDIIIIMVALLSVFWGALLGTLLPPAHGQRINVPYAMTYASSVSAWMAMAALLFLRMPGLRPVPLLLIIAGLLDALWEVGWLATWLTDRSYVGFYYNLGDVACFALIACAVALASSQTVPPSSNSGELRSAHAFVPTLAMLLAMGIVGASLASTRAPDAWILVGLVILTTVLLVARQSAASRKLAALNRELAFRVADARLTELVRQSADAYLIIDTRGIVAFASPSIERHTGTSAFNAVGSRAAALFGAEYEDTLARFISRLTNALEPPAPLELSLESQHGPRRVLKIQGANKLDNVHIKGLTLTLSDISEQRALERDVLTAANLERLRLAGDIHDGLSQELSGIALMLQGLTKSRDLGAAQPRTELRGIVDQVLAAIHGTRDLARGLSPIYVVRGSLCDALQRLGRDNGGEPKVQVFLDPPLFDLIIDELPADHLYRIAREAVQSAAGNGSPRIEIHLRRVDPHLTLEIASDGATDRPAIDNEYGLRLMEYQARIIGATFDSVRKESGGILIRVAVRLWNVAREADAN